MYTGIIIPSILTYLFLKLIGYHEKLKYGGGGILWVAILTFAAIHFFMSE
jgi:hypothetical protein